MAYTGSLVKVGTGVAFSVSTTSGGTYSPVGEMIGDGGIDFKMMFEDATNQQSAGMETLPVFPDYPSIPMECNGVDTDAGQVLLRTASLAGTRLFFKLQFPTSGTQTTSGDLYTGLCYVEQFTPSRPVNKKATNKFKMKVTNGVTLVAGT